MAVWVEKGDVMSRKIHDDEARFLILTQAGVSGLQQLEASRAKTGFAQQPVASLPTLGVTTDDLDEVVEKVRRALARSPGIVAFAVRNPDEFDNVLDVLLDTM